MDEIVEHANRGLKISCSGEKTVLYLVERARIAMKLTKHIVHALKQVTAEFILQK